MPGPATEMSSKGPSKHAEALPESRNRNSESHSAPLQTLTKPMPSPSSTGTSISSSADTSEPQSDIIRYDKDYFTPEQLSHLPTDEEIRAMSSQELRETLIKMGIPMGSGEPRPLPGNPDQDHELEDYDSESGSNDEEGEGERETFRKEKTGMPGGR
ncbi:hypothetical protein MMC10_004987 [Thelotrema lepadinum]|nr:hypothetical protein [Thelotrema lepadinum]